MISRGAITSSPFPHPDYAYPRRARRPCYGAMPSLCVCLASRIEKKFVNFTLGYTCFSHFPFFVA